ncbi:hypothetical protein V5O48_010311 [Marasmius crinis-equi]|uniref:Uncharacterized protein n=1 Tax=Marasmius crinis-equi TaxID=585013 RepID=A0ABR3F8S8_9AGAR
MTGLKKLYTGPSKLVVCPDIGTTFSAVSYSFLEPESTPEIESVTRFPGQGSFSKDKIPTVLAYAADTKKFIAAGHEAVEALANPEKCANLILCEWFKLLVRKNDISLDSFPWALPEGKSLQDIYSDYLRYLLKVTETFIKEHKPKWATVWDSLRPSAEFVLPHPNGWEGAEQELLTQAAIKAELIQNTREGRARIHFVTEGEAALHFCINQRGHSELKSDGVIIVDAGGGTIDISSYAADSGGTIATGTSALFSARETAPALCKLAGSAFVTEAFRRLIEERLKGSRFIDHADHIVDLFDHDTKHHFQDVESPMFIPFTGKRDNDEGRGIRNGQIRLSGAEIANCFQRSVASIVTGVTEILKATASSANGGEHPMIQRAFHSELEVYRPQTDRNKAAAKGGVSYYIDRIVSSRVCRHTYGIHCHIDYHPADPEHLRRKNNVVKSDIGKLELHTAFNIILKKGTTVREGTEFKKAYFVARRSEDHPDLNNISQDILVYEGPEEHPCWMDEGQDRHFRKLATLFAATGHLPKRLIRSVIKGPRRKGSPRSSWYWQIDYDIILLFGGTQLHAQLAWEDEELPTRKMEEQSKEAMEVNFICGAGEVPSDRAPWRVIDPAAPAACRLLMQ